MSNFSLLLNAAQQHHPSNSDRLPLPQHPSLGRHSPYPLHMSMAARSPLPSPPLSNYSYDQAPPPLMSITASNSSTSSTPAPSQAGTPSAPPPPAPPVQPSTIAPPPIQTASDIADAEKIKKKHVCPTCSRPFTTSGHLARHLRVHTGERNHKCPFPGCETRCSRQDNLQQHYRIHLSPRSRRNSNAATRAAIAKAMEAQAAAAASGQSPQPAGSPSTTLTLPPQAAPRHHQPAQIRPPPSPIENALGLDAAQPPYHPPPSRATLQVHHPSAAHGRYPNQYGYESPRSSSASSQQSGPNAAASTGSAAYPSPYSAGPVNHPLPPTGVGANTNPRTVSYDRVANSNSFPSPLSPPANGYPSPEEPQQQQQQQQQHAQHHPNGYGNPSYPPQQAPQQNGYSSHSSYSIPPPQQGGNYYPSHQHANHHAAPPSSAAYPTHSTQSPRPRLPPINPHPSHATPQQWRGSYQHQPQWHSQAPQRGSASPSGDESSSTSAPQSNGWSSAPAPRPVSVTGGGHGSSY